MNCDWPFCGHIMDFFQMLRFFLFHTVHSQQFNGEKAAAYNRDFFSDRAIISHCPNLFKHPYWGKYFIVSTEFEKQPFHNKISTQKY